MGCAFLAWLLVSLAATEVRAQQVSVEAENGPHFSGEPILVRVTATGFAEEPAPEIHVSPPPEGDLQFEGVSPTVTSSIQIANGKISQQRKVRFVYEYRFLAAAPGNYLVGPFEITQGSKRAESRRVRFRVVAMQHSEEMAVQLVLPESPVYVGARLPVSLRFQMSDEIEKNLKSYALTVPFFETSGAFRFVDEDEGEGTFKVQTGGKTLEIPGRVSKGTRGGKGFVVVELRRTMIPLRPGRFGVGPSTLVIDEGSVWRRNLFGRRQATRTRKLKTEDPGGWIKVVSVPEKGRPENFSGAVGRGFELEVSADRTVVEAGEPIELTFVLRGEGLETASMPSLHAEGLLPPADFRAPPDILAGSVLGGEKRFTAVVRVLHEGVREIPPLAYTWFDPETERYETTRSRPIALSVGAGEIVDAGAVRSGEPAASAETEDGALPAATLTGKPSPEFVLAGADLSIERDPSRLFAGHSASPRLAFAGGLYAASLVCVGLALWDRRRRGRDPREIETRNRLAESRRQIDRMGDRKTDGAECAGSIAASLREMLSLCPGAQSPQLDEFLGECDARSFAPAGQALSVDATFVSRARELARQIEEGPS